MPQTTLFTPAEVAFLLRQSIRAVTKAMERGPVRPVRRPRRNTSVRLLDRVGVFYLLVARALRADLTPKARGDLYDALLRAGPRCADEIRFGRFRVAVADVLDELHRRTGDLVELKHQIALADNGKALLTGRGIEAHRIAALLKGGLSVDAVREEYPFLSAAAVEIARAYAQVRPKPGRPYPRTTRARLRREEGLESSDG